MSLLKVKHVSIVCLINAIIIPGVCFSQVNSLQPDSIKGDESTIGYLLIRTDIESVYVVINDDFQNVYHLTRADTISVQPGRQKIRIIQKYYRDLVTNILIKPDELNIINTNLLPFRNFETFKYHSSYPRIFWEAPVVVKTDPDARLYVDGEYIGTGLGRTDTTGYFTVRSELPNGLVKTETFYADSNLRTFFSNELYHRPDKQKARYLALLPGGNQLYQDKKIKGYALLGATIIGSGLAVKFHLDFTDKYRAFENTQKKYLSANDPKVAFEFGNLAEKQFNGAKTAANLRDGFMYGAIGLYIYSIADALLIKPKIGYRETLSLDPYLDFDQSYHGRFGLNASYNF